ncbi:SurA N-terminal domain-containing protein [Novosphingobium colocasiae]|uniref:peptidylprolyl isomerase n=1 Tax=Novosphingobium colocasiae TaxID=1256513 RepID=UPI0035B14666
MISIFRKVIHSKVGAAIALVFVFLMALAFAGGDIANFGRQATGGADADLADVGGKPVTAAAVTQAAKSALERARANDPKATMKMLVLQGGLEEIEDELIDRTAQTVFGESHGVIAGDRLVDSEIARIPAFRGVDDQFSQEVFRQALQQRGISEKELRDDLRQGLISRQLLAPAAIGATMPADLTKRYAGMLDETRKGTAVALPSLLFLPKDKPSGQQLRAFYKAHSEAFIRPERRTIRYALITAAGLKNIPAPTDQEIRARYASNTTDYAPQHNRRLLQLIVPTKAAADAVVAEVSGGKSLEAAAKEKGLATAEIPLLNQQTYAAQSSADVARAVFATAQGKLAPVAKGPLGWHIVRVEQVQDTAGKTLDQVRGEIVTALTMEKRRKAFADLAARIEEQFDNGASLPEVAKVVGAQVQTTPPLTADGAVYLNPGQSAPAELKPVIATAFAMEQEKPQVAETQPAEVLALYDVTAIAASAPAPFEEIHQDVLQAWALETGSAGAKAAALKVQAALRAGKSLQQAVAAAGKPLPPPQSIAMARRQLTMALQEGKQLPPPVTLLFRMAKGTTKVQTADGKRGWFVVTLNDVTPGKADNAAVLEAAQKELSGQLGQAYAEALSTAIRKDVGVKKDPAALKALRQQLGGSLSAATE